MAKRFMFVMGVALVASMATPRVASADWLLSGLIGRVSNGTFTVQDFRGADTSVDLSGSTGFGLNFAKVWPTRGGAGFEFDWGFYPSFWDDQDAGLDFDNRLMIFSPSLFINPALPRVRPYVVVGPTAMLDTGTDTTDTAFGMNIGGGVIAFAGERGGARVDLRYFRNFGEFLSLRRGLETTGGKNLQFFRIFFGGTVVLGSQATP